MSICEFIKVCDLMWEDMDNTKLSGVKYCSQCNQNVYPSHTADDMTMHSCLNHCISMSENHEVAEKIGVVGDTAVTIDWMKPVEFKIYIYLDGPRNEKKENYLNSVFGKKLSDNEIQAVLAGKKVFLIELDRGPAKELVTMVEHNGFKIELVPNQL